MKIIDIIQNIFDNGIDDMNLIDIIEMIVVYLLNKMVKIYMKKLI